MHGGLLLTVWEMTGILRCSRREIEELAARNRLALVGRGTHARLSILDVEHAMRREFEERHAGPLGWRRTYPAKRSRRALARGRN